MDPTPRWEFDTHKADMSRELDEQADALAKLAGHVDTVEKSLRDEMAEWRRWALRFLIAGVTLSGGFLIWLAKKLVDTVFP